VPVKLDADKNKPLAVKYGIRGLPTILFLDPTGKAVDGIVGYRSPKKMVAEFEHVLQRRVTRARSAVRRNARLGENHARLALARAHVGDLEKAVADLAKAKARGYHGPLAAQTYNVLGDRYARLGEFDQAVDAYRRADRIGKTPAIRAHAKCGLMRAYHQKNDLRRARRMAKAVTRLKQAPARYVQIARQYLGK